MFGTGGTPVEAGLTGHIVRFVYGYWQGGYSSARRVRRDYDVHVNLSIPEQSCMDYHGVNDLNGYSLLWRS